MKKVQLAYLHHRGRDSIAIIFDRDAALNKIARKLLPHIRWSKTNNCWYIPMSREHYRQVMEIFGKATKVDDLLLLQHFKNHPVSLAIATMEPPSKDAKKAPLLPIAPPKNPIHRVNAGVLPALQQQLQLKGYSGSTIRTYMAEVTAFLKAIKNNAAESLTTERIRDYLSYCYVDLQLTESTLHSRINALKFYYEQVLKKDKFFWEVPRPKKAIQLPKVLGERELERMFAAVTNIKHKAILFTAYSAGLRVSEAVHLKLNDIDSGRMQIFIECGKGKKDRYVGLSILLLDVLRAYLMQIRPRPLVYLFEGDRPGEPLSMRSAQNVFHAARIKAGIKKDLSFHSLRHRFATHLLEKGIDIRYIKDILGHFSIKTTTRYLHVKREELINIVNPLDELYKGKTWFD
jgi:integrase/recombinase XerD